MPAAGDLTHRYASVDGHTCDLKIAPVILNTVSQLEMQQHHTLWSYELRLDFGVVTYMKTISHNIGGDNRTLKGKSVVDLPKSDDLRIVKYMLQSQVTTRCNVTNNNPLPSTHLVTWCILENWYYCIIHGPALKISHNYWETYVMREGSIIVNVVNMAHCPEYIPVGPHLL